MIIKKINPLYIINSIIVIMNVTFIVFKCIIKDILQFFIQ